MTKVECNRNEVLKKLEELSGYIYDGKVKDNTKVNVKKVKDDKYRVDLAEVETPVKVEKMKHVLLEPETAKRKQENPSMIISWMRYGL